MREAAAVLCDCGISRCDCEHKLGPGPKRLLRVWPWCWVVYIHGACDVCVCVYGLVG